MKTIISIEEHQEIVKRLKKDFNMKIAKIKRVCQLELQRAVNKKERQLTPQSGPKRWFKEVRLAVEQRMRRK